MAREDVQLRLPRGECEVAGVTQFGEARGAHDEQIGLVEGAQRGEQGALTSYDGAEEGPVLDGEG